MLVGFTSHQTSAHIMHTKQQVNTLFLLHLNSTSSHTTHRITSKVLFSP